MYEKYALKLDVKTSDNEALKGLLNDILPEWDKDRVYTSDIKKLVMWYGILAEHAPELIDPAQKEEDEEDESKEEETKKENSPVENQKDLEQNPEEPITISKMETGAKSKKKDKKAEEKLDAIVEAETTAKDIKEKPKKAAAKKTTAKKDDKEAKPKKAAAKKTVKPSAKTAQKPTSKSAAKAVKGKRRR